MSKQFIKIPVSLLERTDLTLSEKVLIAVVKTWSLKTGYCYASNQTLGKILGVNSRHIPRLLTSLKNKKLIKISYKKDNENIEFRAIYTLGQNVMGGGQNVMGGDDKMSENLGQNVNQLDKRLDKYNYKEKNQIEKINSCAKKYQVNLDGLDLDKLNSEELDTLLTSITHADNLAMVTATYITVDNLKKKLEQQTSEDKEKVIKGQNQNSESQMSKIPAKDTNNEIKEISKNEN